MTVEANKKNWYYYRIKDGCDDRFICQYMRLDYLICLLDTKKYYVKRRKEFKDANEGHKDFKLAFGFNYPNISPCQQIESEVREIPYSKISSCPTSCWSMNECESYLMWKGYATEFGACIKSTIHHFISSLNIELNASSVSNKVLCGTMDYKEEIMRSTIEENQLFDKNIVFADENEFRFYFDLNLDEEKNSKGVYIPVNTKVLIDEVILSPFIRKEASESLLKMIEYTYNVDVKLSGIKLSI